MFAYALDGNLKDRHRYLGAGSTLVLSGGTLFDGCDWIEESAVVLEDGRITQLGTVNDLSAPRDAEHISLDEQWLLPGLSDCWVSLTGRRNDQGGGYFARSGPITLYRAVQDAQQLLAAGMTTVVHVGGCRPEYISGLQEAIDSGLISGPSILSAGKALSPLSQDDEAWWLHEGTLDTAQVRSGLRDGDGMLRKSVRRNFAGGADLLMLTLDPLPPSQTTLFSQDELHLIVSEAHQVGARVFSYASSLDASTVALRAGVDVLLHGPQKVDKEFARLLTASSSAWAPALSMRQRHGTSGESVINTLLAFHEAGGTILIGTGRQSGIDQGIFGVEAAALSEAGLPTSAVLAAATTSARHVLGLGEQRIGPGQPVSFTVLEADPRDDLSILGDPGYVSLIAQAMPPRSLGWQQLLMRR